MKQIAKGAMPEFFSKFVAQNKPKTWEDIRPIRRRLREYILQEQGNCCAYTEVRLESEGNCHIDHYKTRNLFPEKTFEFDNLLVSCNSEEYAAKHKDKQIKFKSNYDELINPVEESPSEYIEFAFTGDVLSLKESEKGENTISVFNLNGKSILERRKAVVMNVVSMRSFLSEDELVIAIGEFETMVRQLYKDFPACTEEIL